jgi:hypothetical protein
MPTRRRSVVLITTLVVVGVLWVVAPSASASPATASTLDTPGSIGRAGSVSAAQPAAPPPERWSRTYGSEAGDLTAVTSDGRGAVAAGTMLTSSGTSSSGWVVGVDAAGDVRFQDTYATDGDGRIDDVVPTADGGYLLAGRLDSGNTAADDGWVLKIDATGNEVWQRTLGGAGDDAFTAIQPTEDGYLLAGTKGSGSDTDGWLVKVSAGGDVRWDGSYDNDFDDRVHDIAPHPAGGYLLAGETTAFVGARTDGWTVHVEADGSELQQRTYGGARADGFQDVETLDGDLLLAGESNTYGTSNRRGWVLRRGANGTERWNRTYEVDGTDALAATDDGFVLAGIQTTDAGTRDGVLVGAAPDGTTGWRRAYGGANDDLFSDVLVGPDGGYLLAGTSYSGPGDSTGWLVTLGTVRQQSTPTVTPSTTAPPTTGGNSGTQTADSSGSTGDGGTTQAAAGGQSPIETAGPVDGSKTTTNASAAGGGGSFPWTPVALFLIVVVLGGVFLAIRSQQVGGAFGSGGEDDHGPGPPGDSDPTFGTPSGESQDGTPTGPSQTSHGTPRDPDPLGTNARTPGEAAKLFLASVATWVRLRAPFLDDPRPAESAASTAGTGENAGSAGAGPDQEGDPSEDQSPSTAADTDPGDDLSESPAADASDSASSGEGTVTAAGGAGSSVASGDAQAAESASGSAAAGAATPAGGGDPGTFTLRNPGEQEVVVAFRCQTADETLFNYYAELPPSTIKRARKLPAERPFEITVAITDGPSETRLFQNDGPNGQDVTVTIAPDTIDMVGESEQATDAAVQGTVEPESGESDQSIDTTDDSDPAGAGTGPAMDEGAGADPGAGQGSSTSAAGESSDLTDDGEAAVSDDPSDVLPSADDATDDTVVGEDPGDVLPSGSDDGGTDDADAGSTADSEEPEDGAAAASADDSDDVADDDNHDVTDVSDDAAESESSGGSGFQALKEEFESGDADWADEEADENADDGNDDPFAAADDDLGDDFDDDLGGDLDDDLGESFDDGLGDDFEDDFDDMKDESEAGSDEADESGADDS